MARAVLIMIVGMALIPLGDTFGKSLTSQGVAPIFVAFTRFAIAALALIPFLPRGAWRALRDWRLWLRAALIAGGISSILTALSTEPLANVFGAFFIGPIVAYVLSAWLLGEEATWPRSILLILGFIGVLMVVQPGPGMRVGLLFAVLAGVFYGSFLTASKWLVDVAPPLTLLFSQLAIAAMLTAPFGLAYVPEIDGWTATMIASSAFASMGGNLLLIVAFGLAQSTRLAPFVYFQIVAAAVLGWAVFGTLPDMLALAGMGLLIASGFASLALPTTTRADRR
ncbi:MAG: DMT family transporter [Rhodobacteraceae bacterium]|nr:DMT family transporter [Paracoccaceae bacterium]